MSILTQLSRIGIASSSDFEMSTLIESFMKNAEDFEWKTTFPDFRRWKTLRNWFFSEFNVVLWYDIIEKGAQAVQFQ